MSADNGIGTVGEEIVVAEVEETPAEPMDTANESGREDGAAPGPKAQIVPSWPWNLGFVREGQQGAISRGLEGGSSRGLEGHKGTASRGRGGYEGATSRGRRSHSLRGGVGRPMRGGIGYSTRGRGENRGRFRSRSRYGRYRGRGQRRGNSEDIVEKEDVAQIEYEEPTWSKIQPGRYLLVEFIGGSRKSVHYKYVCRVKSVDQDDGDIEIVGLRVNNESGTDFTVLDADVSCINFDMIKALLPNPVFEQVNRKQIYKFPGSVDVFEKS